MTIVGDLAQRESPAGARSWASMLEEYVPARWTYRRLTINYRMPAEIMEVASAVLAEVDPSLQPPKSVRSGDVRPWSRRTTPDGLAAAVARWPRAESAAVGDGTVAVIAPEGVDVGVASVTPRGAKGLEYDAVIIVEPQRILAGQRRGGGPVRRADPRDPAPRRHPHRGPAGALAGLETRP